MSAVRTVAGATGDFVGLGTGAGVVSSVVTAAGTVPACAGVITVVTGTDPPGATIDITVV
jgi:hypothetical protein